jgi:cell division septum initiation protein DivIVA
MTDNTDLLPDATQEGPFEVQMRGYSRRQVDEFVARSRSHSRDLEERLSRSLDDVERLRLEVSSARQAAAGGKPAHEEVSERIAQILKLASDEAGAQKKHASDEITKLRQDAQQAADNVRAEAKGQAERMLAAAQEQAERAIAAARAEADKTRNAARAEAERTSADSRKNAETEIATAKAQAKQMLDEATARASAIHDGAERRLDLLKNRHSEAMRRLTEIRDVVTDLVSHDDAKGSMDEEVDRMTASTLATSTPAASAKAKAVPAKHASPQHVSAQHSPAQHVPGQGAAPASSPASPSGSAAPSSRPAAGQAAAEDTPVHRAKPGQPTLSQALSNTGIPEADPEEVRVIMP